MKPSAPDTARQATAPEQDVASLSARVALLMYTFLIVYASLYPFSNWQDIGLPMWAFVMMPMPHYWTGFDVGTNVVGYLPFGTLVVFALHPRVRGVPAAVVAIFCGALLSGTMEAIQTFLPNRVSSNLDFLSNLGGTIAGAIIGVPCSRMVLQHSRLRQLRRAWFVTDAGRGLIVAALWPLAQIYPQAYLFGHGQLLPILSDWLSGWLDMEIDLAASITQNMELTVQEYWLADTLITTCGMTGALLLFSCLVRKHAPRTPLLLALFAAAIAVKLLANALLFTPANALAWLTPGAKGGIFLGALMTAGLSYAPPSAQRRIAVASLLLGFTVLNLLPDNPYFIATLQTWSQGRFLNFNGAAHFLSVFWPFLALWFLLHPTHRAQHREAENQQTHR